MRIDFKARCGLLAALALTLAACASNNHGERTAQAAEATSDQVAKGVGDAMVTPLADLNLVRQKIPPALMTAKQAPYAAPADRACPALATELAALDAALGPDLDAPASADNPGLLERGFDSGGKAAVGAVRSSAEGVVPFRGWVRRLSGAERHSREVAAAVTAGGVRRAYLKGVAHAQGCKPIAATAAAAAGDGVNATAGAPAR